MIAGVPALKRADRRAMASCLGRLGRHNEGSLLRERTRKGDEAVAVLIFGELGTAKVNPWLSRIGIYLFFWAH